MKRKYPRNWHLHYSEKSTSDDKKHSDDSHFIGKNVIVSIKYDGENSSIYNTNSHARSLDSNLDSEDRRWIEALRISKIEGKIPNTFRICGENLFYKHTCEYTDLDSMFYVFSIWDNDICLSCDETVNYCNELGLVHVPVIYSGVYNKELILSIFKEYCVNNENTEGFVVRLTDSFHIDTFTTSLSKFVRKSFVIPPQHWRHSAKTLNKLKNNVNPWTII